MTKEKTVNLDTIMNEDLAKKIEKILIQFGQEELGNRLSQFAMIALQNMILNEIRNYKSEVKSDEHKT
jgi:hypothetical protein